MSTSYDTRNTTSLAFLSAHYGVEFSVADDIPREDCPRCDDQGAITTVRVYGDTDDNTSCDLVDCCVGCMDREIKDAISKARDGARLFVELAAHAATGGAR